MALLGMMRLCCAHKYNHFDTDADTFINQHEHSVKHLLLHSTEKKSHTGFEMTFG